MPNSLWTADFWMHDESPLGMDQWPALILLSPRLSHRNVILSKLVHAAHGVSIYNIDPCEYSLNSMLAGLAKQFTAEQTTTTHLMNALSAPQDEPRQWADAVIADMEQLAIYCLVLNDIDCMTDSTHAGEFFSRLVERLGTERKLIINGRLLPLIPWGALVQAGRSGNAVIIGDEQVPGGSIYAIRTSQPAHHIEVYGLASGTVLINGDAISGWDGPLPRNLFYYLIDHHQGVARDEIFETFWPTLTKKEATNVFHVSKGKIAERLGIELTEYRRNFYYASALVTLHYDVAQFEAMVKRARSAHTEDAIAYWTEAVRIYHGPFLSPYNLPWITTRRQELITLYAEALIGLAQAYRATGQSALAVSFFLRALNQTPDREDLHRSVMELYVENGATDKALIQYNILTQQLKQAWGVAPSPVTRALYERITGRVHA